MVIKKTIFGLAKKGLGMLGRKNKLQKNVEILTPKPLDGNYKRSKLSSKIGQMKVSEAKTTSQLKDAIRKLKDTDKNLKKTIKEFKK
mgnify:FL=1